MSGWTNRWNSGTVDGIVAVTMLLFAALLIFPLFTIEYLNNWGSIDSTFIADSRFLVEHWPHPLWQPLWYCGTRFDYVYPPALRYGTAVITKLTGVSTARAYHIYTACMYCVGIAGVYLLARTLKFRRRWAAIATAAVSVLSPSFLLMTSYRDDAALHMPQRLNVLVKWGEGPHVSALSLLPFALLFACRGLRAGAPKDTALAAAFCALLVAHNFYGAVALALCFVLLVWAVWIEYEESAVFGRAVLMILLSYGLTAWWLTPSYLRVTIENLKLVAIPGNAWSRWTVLGMLFAFGAVTWRLRRARKIGARGVLLSGAVLVFSFIVIGHYYAGVRVIGEPHRFVPELDLFLILGIVATLQIATERGSTPVRLAVLSGVGLAAGVSYPYLSRPWSIFVRDINFRDRVEYRMTEWISRHLRDDRVFTTGSLRLWYNAWREGAQVGGGSDQGLLNSALPMVQWQVIRDASAGRDVAWLQAVGANAIVVAQPPSRELYFEYTAPRKFTDVLPVLYDDGAGNIVYGTRRRFAVRARIVRTNDIERLPPIPVSNENGPDIDAYVHVIENGPDREVNLRREGPESIVLQARLEQGESLLVQESYDPSWRAYSGGRTLRLSKDAVGFLLVHAPPGQQEIRLIFELPSENLLGRLLGLVSAVVAIMMLARIAPRSPA